MRLIFVSLIILCVVDAQANSCNPAPAGKQRFNSGKMEFCDGTDWWLIGDGNSTGDSCATTDLGKQKFGPDNFAMDDGMMYCDGSSWISTKVSEGAACTTPGAQRYNIGLGTMEYCAPGASKWINMASSTPPGSTVCGLYMSSGPCDADIQCYWAAGFCQHCNCKQP